MKSSRACRRFPGIAILRMSLGASEFVKRYGRSRLKSGRCHDAHLGDCGASEQRIRLLPRRPPGVE
jgi:hypothetical protein